MMPGSTFMAMTTGFFLRFVAWVSYGSRQFAVILAYRMRTAALRRGIHQSGPQRCTVNPMPRALDDDRS